MTGLAHEWRRERAGVHVNWRRGLTVRRWVGERYWYIDGEPYVAFLTLADAKAEVETRPVVPPFADASASAQAPSSCTGENT